jgi:hypothetical protein
MGINPRSLCLVFFHIFPRIGQFRMVLTAQRFWLSLPQITVLHTARVRLALN